MSKYPIFRSSIQILLSIYYFSRELALLMPQLQKRFKMDKMLERTVAACVNYDEVTRLLDIYQFSPDVILGLTFFHVNDALSQYYSKQQIIKVK